MTQEQFEKLMPYEQELRYITKLQFMSLSQQKFNAIMEVYKEVFNETLNPRQMGCSTCRLRALTRIGKEFDAYKQQLAQADKEERLNTEQPKEKKKVGRPKKIDLDKE